MGHDQSNKLAMMPMGKLLVSMSLPMMVSFFIQALYNIVDSMFVAKLSEDALTAVSLAFPIQQVIVAIGVGTGVGTNAMVPRYMGQGEPQKANLVANTAVFLSVCYSIVFGILGLVGIGPYYQVQTDVASIADGGTTYLTIIVCVSAGVFFGQIFEKLLVCNGYPTLAMFSQASGALFNLVFDPLLIFGLGPFPSMGIAGAAWATVLGQILGALIAFVLNLQKNPNIQFRRPHSIGRFSLDGHHGAVFGNHILREPDPAPVQHHSGRRLRHLDETAELLLHAGFRHEQRYGADSFL